MKTKKLKAEVEKWLLEHGKRQAEVQNGENFAEIGCIEKDIVNPYLKQKKADHKRALFPVIGWGAMSTLTLVNAGQNLANGISSGSTWNFVGTALCAVVAVGEAVLSAFGVPKARKEKETKENLGYEWKTLKDSPEYIEAFKAKNGVKVLKGDSIEGEPKAYRDLFAGELKPVLDDEQSC